MEHLCSTLQLLCVFTRTHSFSTVEVEEACVRGKTYIFIHTIHTYIHTHSSYISTHLFAWREPSFSAGQPFFPFPFLPTWDMLRWCVPFPAVFVVSSCAFCSGTPQAPCHPQWPSHFGFHKSTKDLLKLSGVFAAVDPPLKVRDAPLTVSVAK